MRVRAVLPLLGLAVAASSWPATAEVTDPSCGTLLVTMRSSTVVYRLPRTFIRAGSDSVTWAGHGWQRGRDYVLDAMRGELRLLREPIPGDTLKVEACWLLDPPPIEARFTRYQATHPEQAAPDSAAATPAPSPSNRPMVARDPNVAPEGASIVVSGNKTIAVEFGASQDAFLRQSLDLAVGGTLAPGVELTGVLSDRNTPLTAGGATQDLQSLDRVLIELKAPQGGAALGDIPLVLDEGEFGRLERRLQGVSGNWQAAGFNARAAVASAPGEFNRLQFFGTEGRQGPYTLTDRGGNLGISIVAGSEVVTIDGERMVRGEAADYSIDYERARITFTNRRPITSNTRITVEYQYSTNRYRRNLVTASGRWEGRGLHGYLQAIAEGDDRGRPIDQTFSLSERRVLEAAGDSARAALEGGVTANGGDYDSVRVAGGVLAYAYAGRDLGEFAVEFTRIGERLGDYRDSTVVDGRIVYQYVGDGNGAFRIGRVLPLPTSHQLFTAGLGGAFGPVQVEVEGALSRFDRNTFSTSDDGDNLGEAVRATVRLEGDAPAWLAATTGVQVQARVVNERFEPFSPLERPFAEEDWGLPPSTPLDHQRRIEASGFVRPEAGGELRASLGRLTIPGGFESLKHTVDWSSPGRVTTRLSMIRSDGTQDGFRFGDAGRERLSGDVRLKLAWIEPGLFAVSDERVFASDSARIGFRERETGAELRSGASLPWRARAGISVRRDGDAVADGFLDRTETRSVRLGLDSPGGGRFGAGLNYDRRQLQTLSDGAVTRSDLGSIQLRGESPSRNLTGQVNLELTSEAENRRTRELQFVGPGQGSYDAFGNFVGVGAGDHDLVVAVSPDLERLGRAATSALLAWRFGRGEVWRGSRVTFDYESETSRRGALQSGDPFVSPGAVLGDFGLARAGLLQRLEIELAPGSPSRAFRLRAERRVSGDRSFDNFVQTLDDRSLSARWRARPSTVVTGELEARSRRRDVVQQVSSGGSFQRSLREHTGSAQLVYTPGAQFRLSGNLETVWAKPEGQQDFTRTIRVGPDVGVSIGKGRAELTARRAFESGPPASGLLPTADPVAAPVWEATGRFDYRVRQSVDLGISLIARDRRDRSPRYNGRAELRVFF